MLYCATPSAAFVRRGDLQRRNEEQGFADDVPDFWKSFRKERDPYVKLLDQALCANFYLAFTGRLDSQQLVFGGVARQNGRRVRGGGVDVRRFKREELESPGVELVEERDRIASGRQGER